MIKLIVSDIDGTLVEDGGSRLNPELFSTILKLKEQGIYFVAASGRHVTSIQYLFDPIRDKIFYLADNGAYIGTYNRELFVTKIDEDLVAPIIRDIKDLGMELLIDSPDCVYVDSHKQDFIDWITEGYHFNIQHVKDVADVRRPFLNISGNRMEGIEDRGDILKAKYGDVLKVTPSGDRWVDMMCYGVNKGQALRTLQESLGILPEETMVFGDQLNDLEMMKQGYYSFAVANAKDETKEAARFMADRNISDGVLKILKLLVS